MPREEEANDRAYTVLVNGDEQYSIWFAERDMPRGWRATGQAGKKAECLAFIERVWTDMRPHSLRTWMTANFSAGRADESSSSSS
jgi:MbtH protein